MDDKIKELLEQGIVERSQITFAQMREAIPRFDVLVNELVSLSEEVEHCAGITEEARDLVRRFLSRSSEVDAEFQKYLYIQGARDCVEMLRGLGMIR
ncbi:hypothetical protein SDC9_64481 [bioreactor metagenome]|uniref:Uncharacterized protein n=1 Tax=bioreactor metagenome TaxID=1076179 RepID=A0A644XPL9_9ZZZZ|nr:hypothetical protein [Clostridiaceae bacterium]